MYIITKKQAIALNLKKYFTGKSCKQGHVAERYVSKSSCVECLRISQNNRHEARLKYDKDRYHSFSDEQIAKERERLRIHHYKKYHENPEKFRERARIFHHANKEKRHAYANKWKADNKDKVIAYRQTQEYKESGRFFTSRRRAKHITPKWANLEVIKQIYKECPTGYHVDHIVPLFGKINNIQVVCGLHCEYNLLAIPAKENQSKNCFYWPDMP